MISVGLQNRGRRGANLPNQSSIPRENTGGRQDVNGNRKRSQNTAYLEFSYFLISFLSREFPLNAL